MKFKLRAEMEEKSDVLRVLLVDDDTELCELVSQYLRGRSFFVDSEHDGEIGLRRAQNGSYDMLILDVMLPTLNGFEVLRRLRAGAGGALPVVMLTAHGDEIDRIVGLELGADDYLPKPFNPRELLARMRAVLRRGVEKTVTSTPVPIADVAPAAPTPENKNGVVPDAWLSAGALQLNPASRAVRCEGQSVEVTATEFDLLHVLMQNAGRVVGRDELSRAALGRRLLPLDRSLDLHISKLRRKLDHKCAGTEFIKTVRGVGFLLERDETSAL